MWHNGKYLGGHIFNSHVMKYVLILFSPKQSTELGLSITKLCDTF